MMNKLHIYWVTFKITFLSIYSYTPAYLQLITILEIGVVLIDSYVIVC